MAPLIAPRPLRWLIAAPLSATPVGRRVAVSGERFTTVMSSLSARASATVPDRLGSQSTRNFDVEFPRPTSFRIADVITSVTLLAELGKLTDKLAKDGDAEAAVRAIRGLVGDGRLVDTLQGRPAAPADVPASPRAAAPSPAPVDNDDDDDDDDPIFGKAAVAGTPASQSTEAKSAVGSFIQAMRSGSAAPRTTAAAAPGRETAPALRQAIGATACDLLAAEGPARLERAWRSLRMVMAASPGADDLAVDAVDVDTAALLAALTKELSAEDFERPDAVFVVEPIDDIALLAALAELADAARVPIVVEIAGDLVGFDPSARADMQPPTPQAWTELRAHASASWLCASVGSPVVVHESEAGQTRTQFGGSTAAIAAMASASVASSGAPGALIGKGGALVGPAAHSVTVGGDRPTIPTRHFVPYSTQMVLAERGVAALGSEANSDQLRLVAAPMLGGDTGLPGKILAGRAHRLAVAVRRQLGANASRAELELALDAAAGAFLPRIGVGGVTLRVRDAAAEGLQVDASIGAVLAGASVSFSSDL